MAYLKNEQLTKCHCSDLPLGIENQKQDTDSTVQVLEGKEGGQVQSESEQHRVKDRVGDDGYEVW